MAHKMHNRKYKSPIEENPQKEVLQPYIKIGNFLTTLFYWAKNSFRLHFRSRENKCMKIQIHTLYRLFFRIPLGFSALHHVEVVDLRSKSADL